MKNVGNLLSKREFLRKSIINTLQKMSVNGAPTQLTSENPKPIVLKRRSHANKENVAANAVVPVNVRKKQLDRLNEKPVRKIRRNLSQESIHSKKTNPVKKPQIEIPSGLCKNDKTGIPLTCRLSSHKTPKTSRATESTRNFSRNTPKTSAMKSKPKIAFVDPASLNITHRRRSKSCLAASKKFTVKLISESPIEDGRNAKQLAQHNIECLRLHGKLPKTSADYYQYVKLIGRGSFGKVVLAVHKLTGQRVAIKSIDRSYIENEYSKQKVYREIKILQGIRHANVIRLLEVFQTPNNLMLVMEYAGGGDLQQLVKTRKRVPEKEAKEIFRQVIYAVGHVHSRSILHRDIKLDNIFLDSRGEIKLGDFGVSCILGPGEGTKEQCGTPAYLAPEIGSGQEYQGYGSDMWSLGILLFALLCGTVPFKAPTIQELNRLIRFRIFSFPVELSPEAKNLIDSLICLDPEKRLSIPQVLAHPWLNSCTTSKERWVGSREANQNLNSSLVSTGIPQLNIARLFYKNQGELLSYMDFCSIATDFYTHSLNESVLLRKDQGEKLYQFFQIIETPITLQYNNESVLNKMADFGYPRDLILKSLESGELDHISATYNLLVFCIRNYQ